MTDTGIEPFPLVSWVARRSRRQVQIAGAVVAAYVAWLTVRWIAAVQLDLWWLDTVTTAPVWRIRTFAKVLLAVVAGTVSLAIMLPSLVIANRTPSPPQQKTFVPIAFVAGRLGPLRTWAAWLLPFYFAFRITQAASTHWQEWVLFRNSTPTGRAAPVVGYDLSYHLFTLPLARTSLAWLTQLLIVTGALSWALLVMNGALRIHIRGRRSNPDAIRLLLALGAVFMAVQAVGYWFVRYPSLASSTVGRFSGAGYAEMHSRGLIYRPLAIACVLGCVLLAGAAFGKVRFRYGLGVFVGVVALHLLFAIMLMPVLQRLVVRPSEFARERPYIEHNLVGTQEAYALDQVRQETLALDPAPTTPATVDRVPRFEQTSLAPPFQVLQGTRGTKFTDVDLDRYEVDGTMRPVFVSSRNSARSELPDQSWVNTHLVYTHGDGVVAALADETTPAGALKFDGLQDRLGTADTKLYFGDGLDNWYVVVGSEREEFGGASFDADSGVAVGSNWRQFVSGLGLHDYNLMFTSEIGSSAQLLYRRSLTERIGQLAPFLSVDGDPYPVITSDGVVWVVDTYVTSTRFPYAQAAQMRGLNPSSDLAQIQPNYVHHAALATVNAYDGAVHLYRSDDESPIVAAWDRALPGLFSAADTIPPEIAAHRRYPTDGYLVQTNMLGQYHVDSAATLYSGDDAWLVSPNVQSASDTSASTPARAVWQFVDGLGGDWMSTRPLSPGLSANPSSARDELGALAVADHDTGTMTLYRTVSSTAAQLPSPQVAQSLLASDPDISQLLTLLNANGSTVVFGPNTPLVQDGGLSWYRTIVVNSTAKVSTPRLHSALVISDNGIEVVERTDSADLTNRPNSG